LGRTERGPVGDVCNAQRCIRALVEAYMSTIGQLQFMAPSSDLPVRMMLCGLSEAQRSLVKPRGPEGVDWLD
jgi:hypothetical protein